jgi:hypothetical protein
MFTAEGPDDRDLSMRSGAITSRAATRPRPKKHDAGIGNHVGHTRCSSVGMRFAIFAFALLLVVVATGCGSTADENVAALDEEIATTNLESVSVFLWPGGPTKSGAPCSPSGAWLVDVAATKISGTGCYDGEQQAVDRPLTAAQLTELEIALRALRTTRVSPSACDDSVPTALIQVTRGGQTFDYVGVRSACWTDGKPVTTTTIDKLLAVVRDLGKP